MIAKAEAAGALHDTRLPVCNPADRAEVTDLGVPDLARGVRHDRRQLTEGLAVRHVVVARQRPATAKGVTFMLLEDEFGQVNLIVPPPVYERFRALVRAEPLLLARGRFEHLGRNRNVVVRELESLSPLARRCAEDADVFGSLPAAHHFGHR